MEQILQKLENMLKNYLDQIEEKPFKTVLITMFIYYLFTAMNKKSK